MISSEKEGDVSKDLVLMCKGYMFTFSTVAADGSFLTIPELTLQIDRIKEECDKRIQGPSLGALTSINRTEWCQVSSIHKCDL